MIRRSFGRSLSFPTPRATAGVPKLKGRGSTSLPTRFHPFVSTLSDHLRHLLTWRQTRIRTRPNPDWILDGLSRLDRLLSSLDDLLQHPRVHQILRRRSAWTGRLLEDFLLFADVYCSFRSAVLALKDRRSETRIAIRRKNQVIIASCARLQRQAEKEILRISSAARNVGRWGPVHGNDVEETELAGVVREAVVITAAATASAVAGVAETSAGTVGSAGVTSSVKGSCIVVGSALLTLGSSKRKEAKESERGESLEEWIGEVETWSERLLRSFVNARVFLLNVLTPSL